MQFRLFYRGPLRPNGDREHKHDIRRVFHSQLTELWKQPPLKDYTEPPEELLAEEQKYRATDIIRPIGNFQFVPLVNKSLDLIAQIEIVLLRPEPPGLIITEGGDIDNRIKTLLDSLRMPKSTGELPDEAKPRGNETPYFFCLLEDDLLVTSLSITTDRLLEPVSASEVILVIHVRVKGVRVSIDNMGLIG